MFVISIIQIWGWENDRKKVCLPKATMLKVKQKKNNLGRGLWH
jgi:hypothetical protein